MSVSQNEVFYGNYSPLYSGYDEFSITRAIAAANAEKEAEKKKQEGAKKLEPQGIITIELRMPLCCEGCVEKVHKKLKAMEGVASVVCDQETQKVVVKGTIKR